MPALDFIRRHNPGGRIRDILWYGFCRFLVWVIVQFIFRQRTWGQHRIPATGPVLVVCNHQSFLDLLATNSVIHRDFNFMARHSLFVNPFFAKLIRSLNAFEVEQGKGDVAAIRKAIDLLKLGRMLLVYPEGTRTETGVLGEFQEGIMLLVRRAKPTIVPMAVEGPFNIWPIHGKLKLGGRIGVQFGHPIPADELLALPSKQAMNRLRNEVETLRLDLRNKLRLQTRSQFPPPGPGDADTRTP
jgi:1-acyl-sn-glycerol-3-phosphate acyltransferase